MGLRERLKKNRAKQGRRLRTFVEERFLKLAARLVGRTASDNKHIISESIARDRYTNYHSRFINIDGMDIHYRIEGQGPPLLLLHGFAASLHIWDDWAELLSDKFTLIRIDLPGFGLSGHVSQDHSLGIKTYTHFLKGFIEALELEKVTLAGNSLGGWIAWEFAADFPGLVKDLVLIAPAGFVATENKPDTIEWVTSPRFLNLVRSGIPRIVIKQLVGNSFGNKKLMTKDFVNRYYGLINRPGNLASLIRIASAEEVPRLELLGSLVHRVLIMWGKKDKVIPVSDATLFSNSLSDSEVLIYAEAGHIPMVEFPDQTVQDLVEFLNKG